MDNNMDYKLVSEYFQRMRIPKAEYEQLDLEKHNNFCLRNNSFTRKYHMKAFTVDALGPNKI